MTVSDDLSRSRLTVFFRIFLAIPHLIWFGIWSLGALLLSIIAWIATLVRGQLPDGLHRFYEQYIRYAVHLYSYLYVAANRYPGFTGEPGYEVDVNFAPPAQQNRWTVLFRIFVGIPAILLLAVITGSGGPNASSRSTSGHSSSSTSYGFQLVGILVAGGVIAWFYAMFKARAPEGVARMQWFAVHYGALAWSYLFFMTDRYPRPDPAVLGVPREPIAHPVALQLRDDELERSRLTVFFRLLLAFPHFVWLVLWGIAVLVVAILNWVATLFAGRSPDSFHRFIAAYIRYQVHVYAFVALVANPFPGFAGESGTYPIEAEIAGPERQRRLTVAFRFILLIPAAIIASALGGAMYVSAFLGWWASLFTGRMPRSLRNLSAWTIRYQAQVNSYALLLTDRYAYAGPPA